jgi:NADH-quinone oxidoreductase subunit N
MKWVAVLPELYFTLAAGVFLVPATVRRFGPGRIRASGLVIAAVGIGITLICVRMEGLFFLGTYRVDPFSQLFKVLIAAALFLVVWLCVELDIPNEHHPEFYFLLTTASLGMMLLVSSAELLTLYIALELTSYSLYVLVPLRSPRPVVGGRRSDGEECSVRPEVSKGEKAGTDFRDRKAEVNDGMPIEAGIKYFLIGAGVSAVMLFGLASLYGAARTTHLAELSRVLPEVILTPMGFVGVLFTLSGFFFKLAFFPFHAWGPTVYQAASNQVTTFIATATKVMAIGVITRIVAVSGGSEALGQVLLVLAIASMTLGNLAALVQNDLKRLLGYSAVAHAGYVLIGILSMTRAGYAAALFYAAAYMVMTFICFLVVTKVSVGGRNLGVTELAGLHRRSPVLALALMVGVFSLGGIPPTIGFTGKFLVFTAAMEKGHFLLVLIAMANVAVSLYYYIQIIRAAYLLDPPGDLDSIPLSIFGRCVTVALLVFVGVGGVFPGTLYDIAARAAGVLP